MDEDVFVQVQSPWAVHMGIKLNIIFQEHHKAYIGHKWGSDDPSKQTDKK